MANFFGKSFLLSAFVIVFVITITEVNASRKSVTSYAPSANSVDTHGNPKDKWQHWVNTGEFPLLPQDVAQNKVRAAVWKGPPSTYANNYDYTPVSEYGAYGYDSHADSRWGKTERKPLPLSQVQNDPSLAPGVYHINDDTAFNNRVNNHKYAKPPNNFAAYSANSGGGYAMPANNFDMYGPNYPVPNAMPANNYPRPSSMQGSNYGDDFARPRSVQGNNFATNGANFPEPNAMPTNNFATFGGSSPPKPKSKPRNKLLGLGSKLFGSKSKEEEHNNNQLDSDDFF